MDMIPLQSPTTGLVAKALADAQAQMTNAAKSSTNPHLNSKYADLASVREACVGPLSAHGLALTQTFIPHVGDPVVFDRVEYKKEISNHGRDVSFRECRVPVQVLGYLRTQVTHTSGEWMAGELPVATVWGDPHLLGAAITYLRRYSLSAITGIAADDDDGNGLRDGMREHGRQGTGTAAGRSPRPDGSHTSSRSSPPTEGPLRPRAIVAPAAQPSVSGAVQHGEPVGPPPVVASGAPSPAPATRSASAGRGSSDPSVGRGSPDPAHATVGRGSPDPAHSSDRRSPQPTAAPEPPDVPASSPAPGAHRKINEVKTGRELYHYADSSKVDANLVGWIIATFCGEPWNYPAKISTWSRPQVASAIPTIVRHLEERLATRELVS